MTAEKKLAIAVLNAAIADFTAHGLMDTAWESNRLLLQLKGNKAAYRLTSLQAKIQAGAFLLERQTDPLKRLWFSLAEIDLDAPRKNTEWLRRLSGLRAAERQLRGKVRLESTLTVNKNIDIALTGV